MRTLIVVATMLVLAASASAQPGQTPPYSQPPPATYPGQAPTAYPAYGYQQQMQVQLTVDEQWLLKRGYITDGEQVGGGIVALLFGWGIGHAIQGRWSEKGYIFTLGEGISTGVMIWGMVGLIGDCFEGCSERRQDRYVFLLAGGAIASGVFRIWEIYDAFAGPGEHNRKVTELRARLGMPVPLYTRLSPYVVPNRDRDGGGGFAGVSLRF